MIQGTKCNAIVKSTSHEVSNRNIQNSISLSNCNYRIKEKRKKKKEKRKEKLHLMRITISTYCWTKALSVLLFTYTGC